MNKLDSLYNKRGEFMRNILDTFPNNFFDIIIQQLELKQNLSDNKITLWLNKDCLIEIISWGKLFMLLLKKINMPLDEFLKIFWKAIKRIYKKKKKKYNIQKTSIQVLKGWLKQFSWDDSIDDFSDNICEKFISIMTPQQVSENQI